MKNHRCRFLFGCLALMATLLLMVSQPLLAQPPYVFRAVPSTAPDPVVMFEFDTPEGSTGTDHVIIGKFVVDDLASDLEFRLETTSTATYPITDFKISQFNIPLLNDLDEEVAMLRVRDLSDTESAAPGYRIIMVSVEYEDGYTFASAETWKIRAKQPSSGTLHYWGFWAEGTGEVTVEALLTRPKLIEFIVDGSGDPDVTNFAAFVDFPTTKTISFGEVHTDLADALVPKESYEFINVGTATLDIISVNPASPPGGAYEVTNYPGSASDVLPLAAFTGTVFRCKPTSGTNPTLGPIPNETITITINSSAIPMLQINLANNRAIRLNTAILLDLSGSMLTDIHGVGSWDSNSRPTNPEDVRKIWHAREAGRLFKEVYRNLLQSGRLGLFTYPDLNGNCPDAQQVVALQEVSSNHTFLDQRLNNADPMRIAPESDYFLTPMAEGIKKVYDTLPRGQVDNRSAVVMIGDGQHSCDSNPPNINPADWEPELRDSTIKFYTIPYGDNNAAWTEQLKDISAWTEGFSYPTNLLSVLNDGDIRRTHEKAIRDVLDLQPISDPQGSIRRNQSITHSVCVTRHAYTLTFIVSWDANRENALSANLQNPEGTLITPATAESSPADVGYFSSRSYVGYVVRGQYLDGRAGTGLWKVRLTGSSTIPSGQTVSYSYSVYAQSRLKTNYDLDFWYAGDKGLFKLIIGDQAHRIRNLTATLEYRAPSRSFGKYLASTRIDPKLVLEKPEMIDGKQATLADKKYYALKTVLKKPFDPATRVHQLKLVPIPVKGHKITTGTVSNHYTAVLEDTKVDGLYELVARVKGVTVHGDCFEREISLSQNIGVRLNPNLIRTQIKFKPVKVTPYMPKTLVRSVSAPLAKDMVRISVVFTPQDALGNYLGPGYADEIRFKVTAAEPLGPIVDNLDGSYIQVIQYEKGTVPSVTVFARGITSPVIRMKKPIPCLGFF